MHTVLRAAALSASLLAAAAAHAQFAAPQISPAIAAKLSVRGDLKSIRVGEIRMVRRGDVLVAEADFNNVENRDRTVFYRFKWLDENGMQVGDGEGWKQLPVMGQQTQVVKGVAPRSNAVDLRIEMNVE